MKTSFNGIPEITKCEVEQALLKGFPLNYQFGFCEFYGLRFWIDQNVLIPRPETEYLVDIIVQEFKGKVDCFLDVGTGSGAILLSLLSSGVGRIGIGADLSQKAINVARVNSARFKLPARFIESDRLSKIDGLYDLIVSNPPYIKSKTHRSFVHQSVDQFEPEMALYLADEIYDDWFDEFFIQVREHLHGHFFMEGHEFEIPRQALRLEELGFSKVSVIKDLTGRDRFLRAFYQA